MAAHEQLSIEQFSPHLSSYMKQPFKATYSNLSWNSATQLAPRGTGRMTAQGKPDPVGHEALVNEMLNAHPGDPSGGGSSVAANRFSVGHVNPQGVNQWPGSVADPHERLPRAVEGYRTGAAMPHVLLSDRAGLLRPVDGSHRTVAANTLGLSSIPAVVGHSNRPEPWESFEREDWENTAWRSPI